MTARGTDLVAAEVIEHRGQRILAGEDVPDDLEGLDDLRKSGAVVTRKAYLEAQENLPDPRDRLIVIRDDGKGKDTAKQP